MAWSSNRNNMWIVDGAPGGRAIFAGPRLSVALGLSILLHGMLLQSPAWRIAPPSHAALPDIEVRIQAARATSDRDAIRTRAATIADKQRAQPAGDAAETIAPSTPPTGSAFARRPFWTVPGGASTPSPQMQEIMYRQRQAAIALESLARAGRSRFEAQVLATVGQLSLRAPCRLTVPEAGRVQSRCEVEGDAAAVRAMLDKQGDAPEAMRAGSSLIIDVTPSPSGGVEVNSRRATSS